MFNLQFLTIFVSGFAAAARAVNLEDLPPPPKAGTLARRDGYGPDYSCLDLQDEETFIWGTSDASSNVVLGQLTVRMLGDQENILSMERFKDMTAAVNCTQSSMDITFKDDQTFKYAKAVWDWVNGADNHSFVMVAGTGDCGWNGHRVPFTIFEIDYDEKANTAHLTANASDWKSAIHSYTLDVGQLSNPQGPVKRGDHKKDVTIDFNHDFPINYTSLSAPPYGITLACLSCATFGKFIISAHLKTEFFIPTDVTFGIQPRGVSMEIDPKIILSGDIIPDKTFQARLFTIPIEGITIPGGILDLGPEIQFNAGVTVGPLQGAAGISSGVNIAIPDGATATVDVLDSDLQQSGWNPVVTTKDVTLDARLTGAVRAFINAEVVLAAEAFGIGYTVGVTLGPFIQGKLEAIASTGAACANDLQKRHFAVDFNPTYGVALIAALKDSDGDTKLSTEMGAWIHQLPIICFPFGKPGHVTDTSTTSGDAPAPTHVPEQTYTGNAATSVYASMTATETVPVETVSPVVKLAQPS